jgi:pyridoxamine 5'-phosphate oxidase
LKITRFVKPADIIDSLSQKSYICFGSKVNLLLGEKFGIIPMKNKSDRFQQNGSDASFVVSNPIDQFRHWFKLVRGTDHPEPDAMALATADPFGKPSLRMVLLKGFDEEGFIFFSNYKSRKGNELAENPSAALLFWWDMLNRQVRVEGEVSRLSAHESDRYFDTRPRGSQLAAWASLQSQPLDSYDTLLLRWKTYDEKYHDNTVPRPPFWGGFLLKPIYLEFWQGRANRLHDRITYTLQPDGRWKIERLFP